MTGTTDPARTLEQVVSEALDSALMSDDDRIGVRRALAALVAEPDQLREQVADLIEQRDRLREGHADLTDRLAGYRAALEGIEGSEPIGPEQADAALHRDRLQGWAREALNPQDATGGDAEDISTR